MGNFISTTNPKIVIKDASFSLTITDELMLFEPTSTYNLNFNGNNYIGSYISNSAIIFNNVTSVTCGYIPFTVTDNLGNTYDDVINVIIPCYAIGTKILCYNDEYIKVEDLKVGTLIKTYNNGYKKIEQIFTSKYHGHKTLKKIHNIYKLCKNKLGDNVPFEDLYITGGHSILVDKLSEIEIIKSKAFGLKKIYDKHLLLAYISELFEKDDSDFSQVYHIALENENVYGNYGIYANGVLSESISINCAIKYFSNK